MLRGREIFGIGPMMERLKGQEFDYEAAIQKLEKDLADMVRREDILLAKPRSSRDMQELQEVWDEKNRILKELHPLEAVVKDANDRFEGCSRKREQDLKVAAAKLERDRKALAGDEAFLRESNRVVKRETGIDKLDI